MKIFRHGEALLVEVKSFPKAKTEKTKSLIISHSETGHHHVIESETEIDWAKFRDQIFFEVKTDTPLVHKKTYDKHNTITITPGIYKVIPKTEYDPFQKAVREVWD